MTLIVQKRRIKLKLMRRGLGNRTVAFKSACDRFVYYEHLWPARQIGQIELKSILQFE